MGHYEVGEGGSADRLSRQVLACSCGVSFSAGAPLSGCAWLAALRWHALRNGLQRSGKRGMLKMYEERDSSRFWNGTMAFWAIPKQNSILNREKLNKNWQMGMQNWFL